MDGILNVNKPRGMTSFQVVARLRRLSGEKRVGHAGTLDPEATGVLPVFFGKATRVIEFLLNATKTYRAQIELGVATDTFDGAGRVIRRSDVSGISRGDIEAALPHFYGKIQQLPPMYSAVKHQGQPLHRLARAGITDVPRQQRTAQIYRLEIVHWEWPVVTVDVDCGKGTYIRTLADDLGKLLGHGAYLKDLVRLRYGIFRVEDALSLPCLEEALRGGYGQHFLYAMDSVLSALDAVVISRAEEAVIRHGGSVTLAGAVSAGKGLGGTGRDEHYRAYTHDGHLLGILRYVPETGYWHPRKVFC